MANIVKGQIGNALMSVAPDGIVATADAIYDETKGKSQEKINEDTKQSLAEQANNIGYYECGTAAATAAKEITGGSYKLPAAAPYGGTLKVKFTYKNSASNPTLSINRSPAKPLYYNGSIASSTNTWEDGDVLDLYYDGTNFNAKSFVEKFATGQKVKNVGIDAEPTSGSENLVKSGGVQNELALGAIYDVSAKNPTAGPNNDGKWESLSALLSDANLNTLIPASVRKGGMSIKFVQTSDNKYIQARCIANEFTTDTDKWAFCDDGVYVENSEWKKTVCDAEGKVLYGIKANGNFYFGAGCPSQVRKYVQSQIDATGIDALLATKVDKVTGKSLIDSDIASSQSVVENPIWMEATTDSEDKVLGGRKKDGRIHENVGIDTKDITIKEKVNIDGYIIQNIEDAEYLNILSDSNEKIIKKTSKEGIDCILNNKDFRGNTSFSGDVTIKNNRGANSIKESVSKKMSSINALNPFEYYYPRMVNMKFPLKNSNTKPLVLCHVSDVHGQETQYNRIVDFLNLYNGLYDDVIITGDIVAAQYSDSISYLEAYNNKALLVIGNHDAWERNALPIVIVSAKDDYDKFFAPFISNWKVTQPNDASSGKCYYYKDYPQSNIRLIVADCMHDSQEQTDFITTALNGARQAGYSVIMSQHYPAGNIVPCKVPFQSIDIDGTGFEINPAYVDAVDTFISNGGKFICWLCGHHHVDLFGYIENHPNQLQICIDCTKLSSDFDTARLPGTKTQDSFNFYSFDVETGTFAVLKVGATLDRHLQKKDSIVFDYINKEII